MYQIALPDGDWQIRRGVVSFVRISSHTRKGKSKGEIIMLSKAMVENLNEQVQLESYSSNLYLQMSAWAEVKGLEGCAAFLRAQAQDELAHMQRLFKYVYETGALPIIGTIKAPPTKFKSISELFQ